MIKPFIGKNIFLILVGLVLLSCNENDETPDPCRSSITNLYEGVKFSVLYKDTIIPEDSIEVSFPSDMKFKILDVSYSQVNTWLSASRPNSNESSNNSIYITTLGATDTIQFFDSDWRQDRCGLDFYYSDSVVVRSKRENSHEPGSTIVFFPD